MNMSETPETNDKKIRSISESSDTEYDPHYAPIVSLPEVAISTNEEEEEEMLKLRAKLYRFDTKTEETPEWKERGTGEVKLLRHKENKTVRLVMRRDKTFKVCANHFITPYMELKPSAGSEKAFIYTVIGDFADEIIKSECLAIRFGTIDFANQFKEKFNEARDYVKENCPLYNSDDDEANSHDEANSQDEDVKKDGDKDLSGKMSKLYVEEKNNDKGDSVKN